MRKEIFNLYKYRSNASNFYYPFRILRTINVYRNKAIKILFCGSIYNLTDRPSNAEKQCWDHVISKRMKRSIKEKFDKPRYNLLARPFESFVKSWIAAVYLERAQIQQLACAPTRAPSSTLWRVYIVAPFQCSVLDRAVFANKSVSFVGWILEQGLVKPA